MTKTTKPGLYLRAVQEAGRFAGWEIVRVTEDGVTYWQGWEEDYGRKGVTTRRANERAKDLSRSLGVPFHGKVTQ